MALGRDDERVLYRLLLEADHSPLCEAGEGRRAAETPPVTRLGYVLDLMRTPNTSWSLVEASLKWIAVSGSAIATPPRAR